MRNNDAYKLLYNQLWLPKGQAILDCDSKGSSGIIMDSRVRGNGLQMTEDRGQETEGGRPKTEDGEKGAEDNGQQRNKNLTNTGTEENKALTRLPVLKSDVSVTASAENNSTKNTITTDKKPSKPLIESWDKLTDLINNCTDCKLCNSRKNLVIERGNRNSQWMFIGEAPGENEDIEGLPFVGSAGQLLDKMLLAMKLDKNNDVYICNTVKCRPPQNRNPEIDEIESCHNYLLSQINLVKPKIIVALGRIAAHTLLQTTMATGKLRQQIHYINENIPVIVTYHPAYLLRNPAAKKDTWEDLQLAMKTFAGLSLSA